MAEKQINFNAKRSNIISSLKRKNLNIAKQLKTETKRMVLDEEKTVRVGKLQRDLIQCASLTLYKKTDLGIIQHVASHTCKNKACMVCNFLRQKSIRRKYAQWFDRNSSFNIVELPNGKRKILTNWRLANKHPDAEILQKVNYDVQFFTLTVPHTVKGWRGNTFYQKELKAAFNLMRKEKEWLEWVYGGEAGVEITRGKNGLHIHMHGLLFVKKAARNDSRNILKAILLRLWNKYTIDKSESENEKKEEAKKHKITKAEAPSFKKGNPYMTTADILELDRRGATHVSLDNIFVIKKGKREYVSKHGSKEMLWAVMEAISYHFEPKAFDKKSGEFDIDLLVDLLPSLFNLRIYDRFGVLYGEKPLSMNDTSYAEEFKETIEARKQLAEEQGLGIQEENNEYFITNPAYVYHAGEDKNHKKIVLSNKAKDVQIDLGAFNTTQAIEELSFMVERMHKG